MKKILVIEDNASIRENTKELLELNGFEVCTANNGSEGIDLATKQNPDIVLCDIHMPQVTGFEVFKTMKANPKLAQTLIIFMSASVQHSEKSEAMQLGIDGFIEKPFTEQNLINTIKTVIGNRNKSE